MDVPQEAQETLQRLADLNLSAEEIARFRRKFNAIDIKKDGKITLRELFSISRVCGYKFTVEELTVCDSASFFPCWFHCLCVFFLLNQLSCSPFWRGNLWLCAFLSFCPMTSIKTSKCFHNFFKQFQNRLQKSRFLFMSIPFTFWGDWGSLTGDVRILLNLCFNSLDPLLLAWTWNVEMSNLFLWISWNTRNAGKTIASVCSSSAKMHAFKPADFQDSHVHKKSPQQELRGVVRSVPVHDNFGFWDHLFIELSFLDKFGKEFIPEGQVQCLGRCSPHGTEICNFA